MSAEAALPTVATKADRITITRHPDGRINVEAKAPQPLYGDETYDAIVFDGFYGNGWTLASWWVGEERSKVPVVQLSADDAELYLVALAKLALAANGVSA